MAGAVEALECCRMAPIQWSRMMVVAVAVAVAVTCVGRVNSYPRKEFVSHGKLATQRVRSSITLRNATQGADTTTGAVLMAKDLENNFEKTWNNMTKTTREALGQEEEEKEVTYALAKLEQEEEELSILEWILKTIIQATESYSRSDSLWDWVTGLGEVASPPGTLEEPRFNKFSPFMKALVEYLRQFGFAPYPDPYEPIYVVKSDMVKFFINWIAGIGLFSLTWRSYGPLPDFINEAFGFTGELQQHEKPHDDNEDGKDTGEEDGDEEEEEGVTEDNYYKVGDDGELEEEEEEKTEHESFAVFRQKDPDTEDEMDEEYEMDMGKDGMDMGVGGMDMGKDGMDMGVGGMDMGKDGMDMGVGGMDMGKDGMDMGVGGMDMGKDEMDMGKDGMDISKDGMDMGKDGMDMGKDGMDMGKDGMDMGKNGMDMGTDGMDMGKDGMDMEKDGMNMGMDGMNMGGDGMQMNGDGMHADEDEMIAEDGMVTGSNETRQEDFISSYTHYTSPNQRTDHLHHHYHHPQSLLHQGYRFMYPQHAAGNRYWQQTITGNMHRRVSEKFPPFPNPFQGPPRSFGGNWRYQKLQQPGVAASRNRGKVIRKRPMYREKTLLGPAGRGRVVRRFMARRRPSSSSSASSFPFNLFS